MKFNLTRNRIDKIPKAIIIEELKRVAKIYNYRRFSGREFEKFSKDCSSSTVKNYFDNWDDALNAIGIELKNHRNIRKDKISNRELFAELERIWQKLGHRPSKDEWLNLNPKYSYSTYKNHFKTWFNACAEFINYKSNGTIFEKNNKEAEKLNKQEIVKIDQEEKRNIPLRLRLEILKINNYSCVFCGHSPAMRQGVSLQVDHIIPFSKGGKTTLNNLQVLCDQCNLGKGNNKKFNL